MLNVRIWVSVAATVTAILFITLTYWYPEHAVFWLSVEVVLLPAIYIVGNVYSERLLKTRYRSTLLALAKDLLELNEKYYKEKERTKKNGKEL